MISFAAITPHPPIIVPGIGSGQDLKRVKNTVSGMEILRERFENAKPDAVVLTSPHAPLEYYSFGINQAETLRGNFLDFGFNKAFSFINNRELVQEILNAGKEGNIKMNLHESLLDHGALVPLYYLTKNIQPELVHLSFSFLDFQMHYRYGQMIGKILEQSDKKIAVIASGDLSHRLIPDAPAGYSPEGKKFDEMLIQFLSGKKIQEILDFDLSFVEEAGECGLRSFIILFGILSTREYNFELLSYEGPFGVGYLSAQFAL